ncbi:MAG: Entericidin EcnA/B family protein [Sphingorhabdus sp.]|jgi:entericidin B|nr:Entericidin EcnA/B family protein [Sphingorhabdus sp.]
MRKIIASIIISSALLLGACNTVRGVGDDIKSVGRAGERAID